jgi:hypothetical protein
MKVHPSYVARRLNAPSEEAISALADLANVWSGRARLSATGILTGLSQAETAAHLTLWYSGEVCNGGHAQYFMNPVGSLAHETVAALEHLGLPDAGRILKESLQVFSDRQVPKDRAARLAAIEALDRKQQDHLDRCDQALIAIALGLDAAILQYLRRHKDHVLVPEQA